MSQKTREVITEQNVQRLLTHPFHLAVARIILDMTGSLPESSFDLSWYAGGGISDDRIDLVPTGVPAARVQVDFLRKDPDGVGLAIGEAACLHIPTDLYGDNLSDPLRFVGWALSAVVTGRCEERIYRRRGIIARTVLSLNPGTGAGFIFSRRDVRATIRGAFGRPEEQIIRYEGYVSSSED